MERDGRDPWRLRWEGWIVVCALWPSCCMDERSGDSSAGSGGLFYRGVRSGELDCQLLGGGLSLVSEIPLPGTSAPL